MAGTYVVARGPEGGGGDYWGWVFEHTVPHGSGGIPCM